MSGRSRAARVRGGGNTHHAPEASGEMTLVRERELGGHPQDPGDTLVIRVTGRRYVSTSGAAARRGRCGWATFVEKRSYRALKKWTRSCFSASVNPKPSTLL